MKYKDMRLKLMNQILTGIKVDHHSPFILIIGDNLESNINGRPYLIDLTPHPLQHPSPRGLGMLTWNLCLLEDVNM